MIKQIDFYRDGGTMVITTMDKVKRFVSTDGVIHNDYPLSNSNIVDSGLEKMCAISEIDDYIRHLKNELSKIENIVKKIK